MAGASDLSNREIDREEIARVLAKLPESERLVATLIWLDGLGLDDAAERLGISDEQAAQLHAQAGEAVASGGDFSLRADLAGWLRLDVDAQCAADWRQYDSALAARYERYFEEHQELRGKQRYSARSLEAALPPEWSELSRAIGKGGWHRHHLSGKSSQTLTVGLVGVAAQLDPSLGWLWDALSPLPPARNDGPRLAFEHELPPETLDEHPRQTAVDVLVDYPSCLICIEAKWREDGIGTCSCGKDGASPIEGRCANRVEGRSAYWQAADELLGLPPCQPPAPCTISAAYQAVRNAAAARALAGPDRLAVFGLVYDARNPYFAGCDQWPGWAAALEDAVSANADPQRFAFRSTSWQELLPLLPLDGSTKRWAAEKHGLGSTE